MSAWVFVVVAALVLLVWSAATRRRKSGISERARLEADDTYWSVPLLVNGSERAAWHLLKELPLGAYAVCPKVRIEDFVYASGVERNRLRGYIKSRHVDFLLVDKEWNPMLVVEVDGGSHHHEKRKARDELVDRVLQSAGIPVLRLRVGENWRDRVMEWVTERERAGSATKGGIA